MKHHIQNLCIVAAAAVPLLGVIVSICLAADSQDLRTAANERAVVSAIQHYERTCQNPRSTLDERAVALGLLTRALWQSEGR